jgi:hypothetical protein
MVSETNRCYTPSSLWNELKKEPEGVIKIFIEKKNQYDIWCVSIDKEVKNDNNKS